MLKEVEIPVKMFFILLTTAIIALILSSSPLKAWEMHNFSNEARIFDEYRDNSRSAYTKTIRPGGMASFHNTDRVTVVDRKTGQKIHNPSFKMMEITKEGYVRQR
ncbi:MAG: hypothetical protein LBS60_08715 [Deltaproteobacteria bacterium]|nr:hypothetical protein [Deltaproteobacteria bacterium]